MKKETIKVALTQAEFEKTAEKLAVAEKALSGAEEALDIACTAWKGRKKVLTEEVEESRDEVHVLAKAYREGEREEEVEVDERVKGDVIQTFIVGTKPVKVIRSRPLESGDQAEIDTDEGNDDSPEEGL